MHNSSIESRLIASLLNEQPQNTNRIDLPPLHDPNVLKAPGRPHLLEPTAHASNRPDERSTANSSSQKISQLLSADPTPGDRNGIFSKENADKERQSLSKILQCADEPSNQHVASKKRHRIDAVGGDSHKDDFVQLPQPPPKKQRAPKQVVPPIIIGLFDPPANAALFPPIASSAFHDAHGRNTLNVNVPSDKGKEKESEMRILAGTRHHAVPSVSVNDPANEIGSSQKTPSKKKEKSGTKRKKWTEEETKNLLLGVHKYGIGKWKSILNDPMFKFNERSPPDLKDRFRTICPAGVQGEGKQGKDMSMESTSPPNSTEKASSINSGAMQKPRSTSGLMSENILIEEESPAILPTDSETQPVAPQKERRHHRLLSDLESLGISGPTAFKKSSRRERRPFSEEEDNNIMKGYTKYGPQWAKIQADADLGLKDRRSTDIRDRFRNRWKGVYEGLPVGENVFASKMMGGTDSGAKSESRTPTRYIGEAIGSEQNSSTMKMGTMICNNNTMTERTGTSLPSFTPTEVMGSSDKPSMHRGHSSKDLMALSSNSIYSGNQYPLPGITSQINTPAGKEIFYQLPNPNSSKSLTSNSIHPPSMTSMISEPTLMHEQSTNMFENQSHDFDGNLLAPYQAPGLDMGVEEGVESFGSSTIGEMDIQRFLLSEHENWSQNN